MITQAQDRMIWQESEAGYDSIVSSMPIEGHKKLVLDREDAYSLEGCLRFPQSTPCWDHANFPQQPPRGRESFEGVPKASAYDGLHLLTSTY